ncbi:MAG: alpha-xylosidase [Treponema sp.]|jgi:alpha-D-xyloside xylohydrolase|nr:alpha-xylosidase [Treponema sp.]
MKFTEGYWLRSERANPLYASQAFIIEKHDDRLIVVSPARPILDRGGALDVSTITTEFRSAGKDAIAVRSWHFEGYNPREPRHEIHAAPEPVSFTEDDVSVAMTAGNMTVRVFKKEWGFRFERKEAGASAAAVLTSSGFRNLGYFQFDRGISTMFPEDNYMRADYKPYMNTELSLGADEYVYGLGERFTAFVKNGQQVDIWNEDGGTSSQIGYKNIPFYMTNKNYGVFVDHTSRVSFEAASEKVEYVSFSVPGEEIRYIFIAGDDPKAVLRNYTALLGRPALPPAWSFGLWLSTSFTTNYDEKTTASFIQGMADRNIPLSVFHYDCFWMKELHWCDFEWDERIFPDVKNMLKRVHDRGLKVCVWINPYAAQGTAFFREGLEKGYFLKRADGKGVKQIDNWQPGMALVDFTNAGAEQWYTEKLRGLMRMGVDAFKSDFGERIPIDVVYHNGADPSAMHNYYTYLYNRCVFNAVKAEKGEGEALVFARSAAAGCQQFPVHWGGDNSASYPSMAETLRGGLSLAMSGFSFWSHDIGGFENTAEPDLYKRWVQFGMFSTHSRLHGSKSSRVPWNFDEESCEVLRFFSCLKCRLMPYLYRQAVEARDTGVPVLRSMALEFPDDPAVSYLDRQYMFGESLLIAPVFNAEGRVNFYLPAGFWTHLLSGEIREGGRWHTGDYDYFSLPVFVRPGILFPFGGADDRPDYDYTAGTEFRLYDPNRAFSPGISADARCEVPDLKGKIVLTVTVTYKDRELEARFDGPHKNCSLLLPGISGARVVGGGSAQAGSDGVRIKIDDSAAIAKAIV